MKRVKNLSASLLIGLSILGLGVISSACNGQSPLGMSLEDAESPLVEQAPLFPGDPSNPPPPPDNGDE